MIVVISKKIRSIRKAKNWSQEEIAEKLGMSVSGYAKIERGETRHDIQKLQKIAEVFNVALMELLCNAGNDNNPPDSNSQSSITVSLQIEKIKMEMEKLKMETSFKDEIIALQKQKISHLKHIIEVIECRQNKRT